MIVKAEVQSIFDDTVKIAIPSLEINSVETAISVPPGCTPNFEEGQIVYASFINDDRSRPIILGMLQSPSSSKRLFDINANNISARLSSNLPSNFSASNISYSNLYKIINVSGGIQQELNSILNYIDELSSKIHKLDIKNSSNGEFAEQLASDISLLEIAIDDINTLIGKTSDNSSKTIYGKLNQLETQVDKLVDKIGEFDTKQDFNTIIDGLNKAIDSIQYINSGTPYADTLSDESTSLNGNPLPHAKPLSGVPTTWDDKMMALFGTVYPESSGWYNKPYSSQKEADKHMKWIKCPLWCLDSNDKWFESSRTIGVHEAVADLMLKAFEEIHELPINQRQAFYHPSGNIWAYEYPHGGEHRIGTAVDINSSSNPMLSLPLKDPYWPKGEQSKNDPYFIKVGGTVQNILEKYGFKRGFWSNKNDYMHFSFFGW